MPKLVHSARKGQQPARQGVNRPAKKALTKAQEIRRRVSARVKQLRHHVGIPQWKAALRADIDLRTWQKLEAGTLNATLDVLARVAGALDVSPEDLVSRIEPAVLAKPRS